MKEKKPNYLVLVNEDHRLPDDFEDSVEIISGENVVGRHFQIEKKTYEAFLCLQEDLLKNNGIQIELSSIYRTIQQQENIYQKYLNNFGLEYAKKYVAKPGHSEHHTGIAIDVGVVLDGKFYHTIEDILSVEYLYKTIQEKLPKYGFILRYPRGKESVTKIGYEPWHFRYLDSPEIAKEITDKGLCFEEYCEKA